jgi:sensor histidine kinase YesM
MEILSPFIFGMITMLSIIFLIVIVAVIVKVLRLEANKTSTELWIAEVERSLADQLKDTQSYIIEMETKTNAYTDMRIDKLQSKLNDKGPKELLKG